MDYLPQLANGFNGEIISADSRQVYMGMDIGRKKILLVTMLMKNYPSFDRCDRTKEEFNLFLLINFYNHLAI